MSIMLLVHFLFALLCSGFKRSDLKKKKLVKLNVFFCQTNACSDVVGTGCSWVRSVCCEAPGGAKTPSPTKPQLEVEVLCKLFRE